MFHYFGIKVNRDIEVENSSRYSPFTGEQAANEFFFQVLPRLLMGEKFQFNIDDLKIILQEVYEVPDIRLMIFSTHNRRKVLFTREQLFEKLCMTLRISYLSNFRGYECSIYTTKP